MKSRSGSRCVREEDTVARLGGDEFAVLLENVTLAADAARVVDKIERSLERPVTFGNLSLRATLSIGSATYPKHGDNGQQLLKQADAAMYLIKNSRAASARPAAAPDAARAEPGLGTPAKSGRHGNLHQQFVSISPPRKPALPDMPSPPLGPCPNVGTDPGGSRARATTIALLQYFYQKSARIRFPIPPGCADEPAKPRVDQSCRSCRRARGRRRRRRGDGPAHHAASDPLAWPGAGPGRRLRDFPPWMGACARW
jgi:hypothetical protein